MQKMMKIEPWLSFLLRHPKAQGVFSDLKKAIREGKRYAEIQEKVDGMHKFYVKNKQDNIWFWIAIFAIQLESGCLNYIILEITVSWIQQELRWAARIDYDEDRKQYIKSFCKLKQEIDKHRSKH